MAKVRGAKDNGREDRGPELTSITVAGFKSIGPERTIEVRPLTILAGANSSGKSSMIQPLLLLKQTLEAPYDPGALLLNGPNVKFTRVEQMLFRSAGHAATERFAVGIGLDRESPTKIHFVRGQKTALELDKMQYSDGDTLVSVRPGPFDPDRSAVPGLPTFPEYLRKRHKGPLRCEWVRTRCFLAVRVMAKEKDGEACFVAGINPAAALELLIADLIHLPGLRGNPQRTYPRTAVGSKYPGTFENYVASLIAHFSDQRDAKVLARLGEDLNCLGLTWKVTAKAVDDTQVELHVGRMPQPDRVGAQDLVSIADVGFGVSQALPVVVALAVARPGQVVYIEQPEIHLHPRAQVAMARLLANAANRGARVIVETHSSLVLLGVQTLVGTGELSPDKVKLHWFRQDEKTGATDITSADLDEGGRFGEWPANFDDTIMDAQMQFLNAARKHPVAG